MKRRIRISRAAFAAVAILSFTPGVSLSQSLVLDPLSPGLGAASSADMLRPAVAPAPGPLPPPVIGNSAADLGLLPGDVIDAMSYGDDGGLAGALHFSVDRASVGAGPTPTPPDIFSEIFLTPGGSQPGVSGDLFSSFDPAIGAPGHTQILDANGVPFFVPSFYGGFGLGLVEELPLPGPPLNDEMIAFEWGAPGKIVIGCMGFSLAAGSPTLTPGTNPLLPAGANPADLLVSCPGAPIATFLPAATMGLIAGPPGCSPPACDDMDALTVSFPSGTFAFSLAPGSPTLTMFALSAADLFGGPIGPLAGPPAPVAISAAALGLVAGDDVDALETILNLCPVPVALDPDLDGIGPCDNCPAVFNPGQEDSDGDLAGDACDPCTDLEGDGFGSPGFPANLCPVDLCPFIPGPNGDADGDTIGDVCDNCPLVANTGQSDVDFDAAGDVCDLCPHVFAGVPSPFTSLVKAQLGYKNGIGGGDDSAKIGKAVFTTATPFDPDSTDSVHVTVSNTTTSATLYSASLPAGASWTQADPAKLFWKYAAAGPPQFKSSIKEAPAASPIYQFKHSEKLTTLTGPQIAPATDDLRVTMEITPAGLCFSSTLATCTSKVGKKDQCKP